MGVSSTTNTAIYQGDGTTTAFSFAYYFFKQTDLSVFLYSSIFGTITPLTLGVNYTITGTANYQGLYPNGAMVNLSLAPTTTQMLVITRAPVETQNYALSQGGTISSAALVQELDYLTLLIQSLQDQVNRCVQLPAGFGPNFSTVLPSNLAMPVSAGQYLQVNALSNGLTVVPNVAWFSQTYTYSQLQASSPTIVLPLVSLAPTAILIGVCIKHSVAFAGTGLTDVYLQVGPSTAPAQFISYFSVAQSPADQAFSYTNPQYLGSWANATPIVVKAVAVGGNLSALSQGAVTVYYNYQFV